MHSAVPGADVTIPVVSQLLPDPDIPLRGNVCLSAVATDNVGVAGIRFAYRVKGEDEWKPIADITNLTNGKAEYQWNTTDIPNDGIYEVRAQAYDAEGNSAVVAADYTLANNPPAPPQNLEIYAGQWQLIITFDAVDRKSVV